MKTNKILFILLLVYLLAFSIYGASRVLVRNENVIENIPSRVDGWGIKKVIYFERIFVLKPYEPLKMGDLITSAFLILSGISCFITYFVLKNLPHKVKDKSLWFFFFIGFIYLGLDEMLLIHEFIGLNLALLFYNNYSLENIINKDFNDTIILLYAVVAFIVFALQFSFFKRNRLAFLFLSIGFLFQVAAAILDYSWKSFYALKKSFWLSHLFIYREEFFEMTAAAFYFSAFILYSMTTIAEHYHNIGGNYILKVRKESIESTSLRLHTISNVTPLRISSKKYIWPMHINHK